jgi:AcrR family transcriptional regulator
MKKTKLTKEFIIEKTIELINREGSSKDINFRGIARELDCAHTSIYNYFDSFDKLLFECMIVSIDNFRRYIHKEISVNTGFEKFIAAITGYFFANKGIYRLLWLDNISEENMKKINETVERSENIFIPQMDKMGIGFDGEKSKRLFNLLHSYLHGELAKFINGRSIFGSIDELNENIITNSRGIINCFNK